MNRISFRARVFLLVVVVAVTTAAATAWLTVQQATRQVERSTALAQQDLDRVVSDITTFGLLRASWRDVGGLVSELARSAGQRVRVMTTEGIAVADSDPAAGAVPARQTVTVETRPVLHLDDGPPLRAREAVLTLFGYRNELDRGRCWQQRGVRLEVVTRHSGMNGFVPASPVDAAGTCPAAAFVVNDDFRAREERISASCSPTQDAPCVQRAFADQLAQVTPPPVLVLIGTLDQPPPTRIALMPALAASGLVALIVLAVSLLISRRVLRPIGALAAATRRLGDGDLVERVPERGRDELAQLSRSFNRMAESLQRSREQQHNMIADIAHELRTPLANIRGYLEALKDGVFPPDPELFRSLHEEAVLQQRLIDDLQELALAESGSLVYHPSRVDLTDLLHACRTAHATAAAAREVRIEVDAPDAVFTSVDQDRLRQVVGNLITNALRATPAGGVITLRSRAEDDSAVVDVADTGSGIAPEHLPHVFDRFWRADTARGRETGGRGLGLAIAREIITSHGGTITVASTTGTGTVFTVRLPLDRDA